MNQEKNDYSDFKFRTLNYLGSKLRLLEFIKEHVVRITPDGAGVCDLFAGSGVVSYFLSPFYSVTSCDIQHYSKVICNALLLPNSLSNDRISSFISDIREKEKNASLKKAFSPLINIENEAIFNKNLELLSDIVDYGSLAVFNQEKVSSRITTAQIQVVENLKESGVKDVDSIISRFYGGVYFSYLQSVQIDIILSEIRLQSNHDDRNVLLAALLSTASDITCTVGKHFAQPIKTHDSKGNIKTLVYNKAIKDKNIELIPLYEKWVKKYQSLQKGPYRNIIAQGDYIDCLKQLPDHVKTVYADPPYTRDHYSRFYHVLETMALGDAPALSTVKKDGCFHVSNGIYRKDRHQSPFCIRSKASQAFDNLFKMVSMAERNLLLSYSPYDESKASHPRVVTIEQLISLASKYFDNIEVVSAGHFTHNKLNSTEHFLESSDEAEMLIVCTNTQNAVKRQQEFLI